MKHRVFDWCNSLLNHDAIFNILTFTLQYRRVWFRNGNLFHFGNVIPVESCASEILLSIAERIQSVEKSSDVSGYRDPRSIDVNISTSQTMLSPMHTTQRQSQTMWSPVYTIGVRFGMKPGLKIRIASIRRCRAIGIVSGTLREIDWDATVAYAVAAFAGVYRTINGRRCESFKY